MLGLRSDKGKRAFAPDPAAATHLQLRVPEGEALEVPRHYENLLGDPRLQSVESVEVVVPGATLTAAVQEILRAVLRSLPRARAVELVAPGVTAPYPLETALALTRLARERGAELGFGFVLDADADGFAAAAHPDAGSLGPVLAASRGLLGARQGSEPPIRVRWWVPARPELVYRLEAIFSLARDEGVDAVLVPVWCLPHGLGAGGELGPDQLLFVRDFLAYRLLEEDRYDTAPDRVAYYEWLRDAIDGAGPRRPAGARPVATLGPRRAGGEAEVALENRPTLGDMAGLAPKETRPGALEKLKAQALDLGGVVLDGDRALLRWARAQAPRPGRARPIPEGTQLPVVLVIGAYGGDHIGDAAILGGVLLRVNRRFGTKKAILMSQRPEHTRRLARMLVLPVEITVELYEHGPIKAAVPQVDAVVYAGGPMMDLPKQLVRHLYAASLAQAQGKPLVLEGIGAGPFKRKPSEWIGRQLSLMAGSIVLRTRADAENAVMQGLDPKVGRDPAFDYLESRTPPDRYPKEDAAWIERLLAGTEGKRLVAINLRPIREMFTEGVEAARRAAYTQEVEERFSAQLAEGMARYAVESDVPVCFIYFCMNSIQFGSSDLRSAYRVQRHLPAGVEYRVWEGDPSIDGVLTLLKRMDLVIAMRFHANIFALSQGCPVVGIDYRPGKRDKVDALHRDRGTIENVSRIDEMTSGWLVERLRALTPKGPGSAR
jgi:polysaccharide pyruvyl transferase WcaK-like protein